MIWQPEFTDKTLSRKTGAVQTGNQHKYQTRVVSSANQVNLKFEEAKPHLEDQLAKSIANIL
nr:complement resistance protein TraT [Escherichia coli]